MKKIAKIENGIVSNIEKFDGDDIPNGYIDVTETKCDIGDPVVDGSPVERPSEFHTVKEKHDADVLKKTEFDDKKKEVGLKDMSLADREKFVDDNTQKAVLKALMAYI
jgi:hypothetical protein